MKKFLAYLLVIVISVSLGFAVFYLVRDNEKISLSTTTLYKDKGSTFELALDMTKNNSYTKITVNSSNEKVVSIKNREIDVKKGVAKATLMANEGGIVRVNFQTNNSKFRNLYCDITIGDGSKENPYFISNPAQLASIGKELENGEENKYTLDSHYEIVENLDLSQVDDVWKPIGNEVNKFTGSINGNGHTIYNMNISNSASKNIGLFSNIGANGKVENVKFTNINIVGSDDTQSIGTVAGVNEGTISRVEITNLTISSLARNCYIGGVAGKNLSSFSTVAPINATIIRSFAELTLNGGTNGEFTNGINGYVGGITAINQGGTVAYTYTKGNAVLGENLNIYGGIIGNNKYVENPGSVSGYSKDLAGFVRDCYTLVNVNSDSVGVASVGAIIGQNTDRAGEDKVNQILGCYYGENINLSNGIGGNADEKYVAQAMTESNMKSLSNYVSYIEKEPYIENGDIKYKDGDIVYWDTKIWSIVNGQNQGYPIINMTAMEVNPHISGDSFERVSTLQDWHDRISSGLDGNYLIPEHLENTTNFEWTPIGTIEKPFIGQICSEGDHVSTIKGLKIKENLDQKYSGMFGVIGNGAIIKNICLEDAIVASNNVEVAGAVAAYNNGNIENCIVKNGIVKASKIVGGIAGVNEGTITSCDVVGGVVGEEMMSAGNSLVLNVISSETAIIGGMVGKNSGSIVANIQNTNSVKGFVNLQSASVLSDRLYMGGVAGQNDGDISYAVVELNYSDGNTKYGMQIGNVNAYVGGIAGRTTGHIARVRVSANILASAEKDTYVGGVAGVFVAKEGKDKIEFANITNSNLNGKYVGGLVASINTSYSEKLAFNNNWLRNFTSEQYKVKSSVYNDGLKYVLYASAVNDDVSLGGSYTAGIAYDITKGVVLDCYSQANLGGENNAGLVYYIRFNKDKEGGLMTRCYAVVKFDAGSKNFQVSASNIHSDGWDINKRTAGFIDDYYYTVVKDKNSKEPVYSGNLIIGVGNLFTNDSNRITKRDRNASTMKGDSLWSSFVANSGVTGTSVWSVGGGYPTINGLI